MDRNFQVPRGIPISPPQRKGLSQPPGSATTTQDFGRIMQEELQKSSLKFSAHAEKRLLANKIKLNPSQLTQLESAVDRVRQKGGKETLVLVDNLAFVISVPNHTVITAIDKERMRENVFTNIDSAVIT